MIWCVTGSEDDAFEAYGGIVKGDVDDTLNFAGKLAEDRRSSCCISIIAMWVWISDITKSWLELVRTSSDVEGFWWSICAKGKHVSKFGAVSSKYGLII
jgi:hypothetical protein